MSSHKELNRTFWLTSESSQITVLTLQTSQNWNPNVSTALGRLSVLCYISCLSHSMRLVVLIYLTVHIILNSCFRKLDGVPRTKLWPNTVCHRPKLKPTRRNYTELEVSAEEVYFLWRLWQRISWPVSGTGNRDGNGKSISRRQNAATAAGNGSAKDF